MSARTHPTALAIPALIGMEGSYTRNHLSTVTSDQANPDILIRFPLSSLSAHNWPHSTALRPHMSDS